MIFLSAFENKIDRKGRVSVPAPYRAALVEANQPLIINHSLIHPCLEGQGASRINQIVEALDRMDALSGEADILQAWLASAMITRLDSEGRISLPENFLAHADITDTVVFAGAGRLFRLWNRDAWHNETAKHKKRIAEGGAPKLILQPAPTDKGGS